MQNPYPSKDEKRPQQIIGAWLCLFRPEVRVLNRTDEPGVETLHNGREFCRSGRSYDDLKSQFPAGYACVLNLDGMIEKGVRGCVLRRQEPKKVRWPRPRT